MQTSIEVTRPKIQIETHVQKENRRKQFRLQHPELQTSIEVTRVIRLCKNRFSSTGAMFAATMFPDKKRIVAVNANEIMIWNIESKQKLCTMQVCDTKNWVKAVAVFADEHRVVSGSTDNKVKIWDVASGVCLNTLSGQSDSVN